MLVLSRRVGESIKIGDDITITLVEMPKWRSGELKGRVKLGIVAPRSVPVVRSELLENRKEDDSADRDEANSEK
jgi:carbon storage regulator